MSNSISQRLRGALFASTALLALPAAAIAGEVQRPVDADDSAQQQALLTDALNDAAQDAQEMQSQRLDTLVVVDSPEITINNNFTPTQARDPVNINGIGQIVTDGGGGSVGLCTSSLINPRVVLFAAHCVNTRAATAYGAGSGGVGIAVGFETNTRANAAGQPDELVNWLTGGSTGPGRFQTNRAQQLYNIEQVFWNPASISAASCTSPTSCFLEADIATAVLDAPTRGVPTWALLFSPLATPSAINPATGTGYHVTVAGYGANGTGTTGAAGSDFRRRSAENMLGALTSISTRNLFLFGSAGTPSRPQLLYWLDFDDPARGTAAANPRDFNGFRDNALTREGTTGPGDSGGPLILDQTFSKSVILGVLSGGSTFFGGQPGGSYGTQSFYQPLFLYWDWIVANNPYRYVTANAGNRNWEDATSWVTTLDPAYNILSGGALVNGIPTELGGTNVARTPQFGELCFQSPLNSATPPSTNECEILPNNTPRNNVPNTPSGTSDSAPTLTAILTDAAAPDSVKIAENDGSAVSTTDVATSIRRDGLTGAVESPMAAPGFRDGPLPAPTLANGLPGATNFVPNNVNGVRTTGVAGRYYDVTLRNAGIVTLNSAVTIDRFTVLGASSQLTVNAGASLTSLIDVMHSTGIVQNNGTITTGGDYLFASGLLSGTGRVNTPFLTSALGNFAPGTLGTVGTLTIGGNLVMASGSTFAVDLGPGNTSDRLAVVANGPSTGLATIGGRVVFSAAGGNIIRNNDLYTILTASGGVTGTFSTTALSAILTPQFVYSANTVQARIVAGSYFPLALTPVQRSFAALLDRNRGGSNVAPLYDFLDLQNAGTIQATLESWAPRTETLKSAIGTTAIDNMNRFFRGRLASMDVVNGFGGQVATLGNPLQAVSRMSSSQLQPGQPVMNYGQDGVEESAALPETVSVFFAGGYLDGNSASMATAVPFGGEDNFDGYYAAVGVETELDDNAGIGFALSYTDIDGTTGGVAQGAEGKLYQGTLYGKYQAENGVVLDTQVSAAMLSARTDRDTVLGPTSYRLQSKDDVLALSAEVGLGKSFEAGSLDIGPRVAMRTSRIEFTPTTETGGPNALSFNRGQYDSLQGMAGLTLSGGTLKFRPYASAYYVHEFLDKPASFGANFVGGVGLPAVFALTGTDKNWFEASAGIAFGSETFEVALGADTTIGRSDVSNQSYRGTVTFRF